MEREEIAADLRDTVPISGSVAELSPENSPGGASHPDTFLARIDPSGVVEWAASYGGSGHDTGLGVATHAASPTRWSTSCLAKEVPTR